MKTAYYEQVRAFVSKDWGIEIPETYTEFMEQAGEQVPKELTHIG